MAFPEISRLHFLQALVIAAAACWIYWPVLHGGWLMDDDIYLTGNPLLHDPDRLWKAWFEPGSFIEYYPIQQTLQWMQWQLFHEDTLGYHVTNLLLHIISALLVWRLLSKFKLRLAWLGGLVFAIHPTMVESVAWIAEFKNTLSLPPFLLAMCCYLDFDEQRQRSDYLAALGWFVVAMLCKIGMATFPVVILLYAWWKRGRIGWSDLLASVPFFVVALELGVTTHLVGAWYAQSHHLDTESAQLGGLASRLALAGLTTAFYLWNCVWPIGLLPMYPLWQTNPPTLPQFLPGLVLGALIVWFWSRRTGWGRQALLGFGFFLILLAPFSGIHPISYMTFTSAMDHFLYLPIIGLIGLVVAGLEQIEARLTPALRPCGIGFLAVLLASLAWESHGYAEKFIDQETLWTYTLSHNPNAFLAQNDLGIVLVKQGRIDEGIVHLREAVRLRPNYIEAYNNLGIALIQSGQVDDAITEFRTALGYSPGSIKVGNNLGKAYVVANRFQEAGTEFVTIIQRHPDDAAAYANLGDLLVRLQRVPEAQAMYEKALQIDPDNAQARSGQAELQGLVR